MYVPYQPTGPLCSSNKYNLNHYLEVTCNRLLVPQPKGLDSNGNYGFRATLMLTTAERGGSTYLADYIVPAVNAITGLCKRQSRAAPLSN